MDSEMVQPRHPVRYCYRHPHRPTLLRCSKCDRSICPDCYREASVGQRCPDCSRSTTRVMSGRGLRSGITPAVLTIIVLSAVVYLIQRQSAQFTFDYAHLTAEVRQGEWWRVITAAFLHSRGGFLHILFNMYALYLFGPRIERQVGAAAFVGLYLASATTGGLAFQYFSEGGAVGASGAIFGLFGAVLAGIYRVRNTPHGGAAFRQLLLLLVINLSLPFLVPSVAWEAHVGGLLGGIGIATLWQRIPAGPRASMLRALTAYGLGLVALLVIVAA